MTFWFLHFLDHAARTLAARPALLALSGGAFTFCALPVRLS